MNPNQLYLNGSQNDVETRMNSTHFLKNMIAHIHKCRPLWDRDCTDRYSRQSMWSKTANTLGIDVEICMQKWKGLREKYIRQKKKYLECGEKWEFLDDLSFLDTVINYRKRPSHVGDNNYSNDSQFDQFSSDYDVSELNENEIIKVIKTEEQMSTINADSTLDGGRSTEVLNYRKREATPERNEFVPKKNRCEHTRTPEEIFGEFVAASLANKSESEKNAAMVQIMAVLTKTN